jgi:hypothetical protein
VVDDKGQPVRDATVVGAPNGDRRKRFDLYGQPTTDAQGHFSLRTQSRRVRRNRKGRTRGQRPRSEFLKSCEDRGQKVQLDEGLRKTVTVKVIPAIDDVL